MTLSRSIRQIFALATLLCSPCAWAVENVVVTGADGVKATFSLADSPKVTFSGQKLIIAAGEQVVEFPADSQVKFEFSSEGGLADAAQPWPIFAIGETLQASGLQPGSNIAAYAIDGRLIARTKADADGCAVLDLSAARGAVIIKSATHTFKISK